MSDHKHRWVTDVTVTPMDDMHQGEHSQLALHKVTHAYLSLVESRYVVCAEPGCIARPDMPDAVQLPVKERSS